MNDGPYRWQETGNGKRRPIPDPFDNEHMSMAWDAVHADRPEILDHISGIAIDEALSLAVCVAAFHKAAIGPPVFALTPELLTGGISHFAEGAFASRAGSAQLLEDVRLLWRECNKAYEDDTDRKAADLKLASYLSASSWLTRELPTVDRLLGDFLTTTTRGFIIGRTGLGKTMLGLAAAMGAAFGTGFLHWRSSRPARIVYLDGEMPRELLIERIQDAARRIGRSNLLGNLMVFSIEDAEEIAERFPMLGMMEALNTEPGHDFVKRLVKMLKPDAIIFDNVQSLLAGVQKEEETWIGALPIFQWLTKQRVGQLWFDHTGHEGVRQYGSVVKGWRSDTLGLMAPLPDDQQQADGELAFTLSFEHPGKARRRTPKNWQDFAPHIIRLREDEWTSEQVDKATGCCGGSFGKVPPSRAIFHSALIDAISHAGTRPGETTMLAWEGECVRRGLIEAVLPADPTSTRRAKRAILRVAQSALLAAHWIGVDGDRVMDLKGTYR
jgi:AAA domain